MLRKHALAIALILLTAALLSGCGYIVVESQSIIIGQDAQRPDD